MRNVIMMGMNSTLICRYLTVSTVILMAWTGPAVAQQYSPDRCEIVPLANHELSLRIDGREKLRWKTALRKNLWVAPGTPITDD